MLISSTKIASVILGKTPPKSYGMGLSSPPPYGQCLQLCDFFCSEGLPYGDVVAWYGIIVLWSSIVVQNMCFCFLMALICIDTKPFCSWGEAKRRQVWLPNKANNGNGWPSPNNTRGKQERLLHLPLTRGNMKNCTLAKTCLQKI